MPKRTDIKKILLIGSGPIVIGQACEFDYSGTQAVRSLKEEGYEVILINSNPATIMTDPELADRVYIEPVTTDVIEQIIIKEKPDAILPTMGGQTALNVTLKLVALGIPEKYNVEILGAKPEVIEKAEDRELFKAAMTKIGVESAKSYIVRSWSDAKSLIADVGLPLVLRPSFTLGGEGGGAVFTEDELKEKIERALFLSPTNDVLVEESLIGWKEFELEVVRDNKDNVIIVCSIENLDPMGVHTGDSITVAPAQTLTDKEYQNLRDIAIRVIREIGVETGGSNIQFAVNPEDGRVIVIEMNPRVSRSSALASKATGFPIARVASKLAVGYSLDELTNDITKTTPSSFEPAIDYVVVKIPRFDFEKFQPTTPELGTQMKSVGEVMAIGQTFEEALGKAVSGTERKPYWLAPFDGPDCQWELIDRPHFLRLRAVADAIRKGVDIQKLNRRTAIDIWFLSKLKKHLELEKYIQPASWPVDYAVLDKLKKNGWTDWAIAKNALVPEEEVRSLRIKLDIHPVYRMVDTCAGEFVAETPFYFSTYFGKNESIPDLKSGKKKVMILGGGPNRIGQGIEFDYCCVHAAMSLREAGYETIMVNCNPETVSTDFDISDKLYFEPLTVEHVLAVARIENPLGVIVQFGGQTPLKLARRLEAAGLNVLGTSVDSIDLAEDRKRCGKVVSELEKIGLLQPPGDTAFSTSEAIQIGETLGYPLLVRPSYVLGGQGMRVVHSRSELELYVDEAIELSEEHPILMDRFLDRAIEVDVDAISDGTECIIGGLMEHVEEAGVHSGDSSSTLPAVTIPVGVQERVRTYTRELAKRLQVKGLLNVQFAIQGESVYLLEVNPRGSRTVPFISKATGKPMAKYAARVMLGESLKDIGLKNDFDADLDTYNVKAPVFPFDRFPGVDVILGPEMKSTGEVMGRAANFPAAYGKAMLAKSLIVPESGAVFMSIRDEDKAEALPIAKDLFELGFQIWGTNGTADFLSGHGIDVTRVNKVRQGSPHCVDFVQDGKFVLAINTTSDGKAIRDSFAIRRAVLEKRIPYSTVLSSARAIVDAIKSKKGEPWGVSSL